jgi:hypothetical protein
LTGSATAFSTLVFSVAIGLTSFLGYSFDFLLSSVLTLAVASFDLTGDATISPSPFLTIAAGFTYIID